MIKLVIFDVDGVLVKTKSSWEYLHSYYGVMEEARRLKELFEKGEIDYQRWMDEDIKLWIRSRGIIKREEISAILASIPLEDGAVEIARWLKRRKVRIALLSSGIDLLVSRVARELGADLWMANKLLFDKNGLLYGGAPVVGASKDRAARLIMATMGVEAKSTMYVGDSKWDGSAMRLVEHSVAYGDRGDLQGVARYRVTSLLELRELIECIESSRDCERFLNVDLRRA